MYVFVRVDKKIFVIKEIFVIKLLFLVILVIRFDINLYLY